MIFGNKEYIRTLEEENRELKTDRQVVSALNQHIPTITFTPDGIIRQASDGFLSSVGYTLEQIQGKHHRLFCDANYAGSQEYHRFWHDLAQGKAQQGTYVRKKSNGEPIWLEASYIPVRDEQGTVIEVLKIAYDVTEKQQNFTLVQSVYNAIDRSSAMIEFDLQGNILTANGNFLRAVGGSLDQIVGKHHRIFCNDSFYQENPDFWSELARGEFKSGQFERRTLHGDELWLEATYNPILDTDGKAFKVIKVASDVTAQVKESRAITRTSELSVSTAEETMQIAKEGVNLLDESLNKSNQILEEVSSTNEILKKLNDQSGSIEAIVSTISGIADQTNLLALNAAIEAARAGEQGRGFAVVADEVRQLASRTSESTTEIESVVSENKVLSGSATEKMSAVTESVELSNRQLAQVNEVMREIRDGAENVSRTAAELVR